MSNHPEHDKQSKVKDKSQIIGEFVEWLATQNLCICDIIETQNPDVEDDYFSPITKTTLRLLAEYFNIDLEKIEKEKQKVLIELRKTPKEPLVRKED